MTRRAVAEPFGGLVDDLLRSAPTDVVVVLNADAVAFLGDGPVAVWLPGEPTDVARHRVGFEPRQRGVA